jgi:hypothetical protein
MHGLVMASGGSDPTSIAALVLAAITLALVLAALALVAATRAELARARSDVAKDLDLLRAEHRPLLLDVPLTASGSTSEIRFPGLDPRSLDPHTVFVASEAEKLYVSVPIRNAGHGVAVIDGEGVVLTGPLIEGAEYRKVQQEHLPVGETTRVDLIAASVPLQRSDPPEQGSAVRGVAWQLAVPYRDFGGGQRSVAQLEIVCRGDDLTGPWLVEQVAHEVSTGQITRRDDSPDLSSSERADARPERAGVRGEPVVDLWGNPVRPRRRNR